MSIDVLIISTYCNEIDAAYRRLYFFVKLLCNRGLKAKCLGFPLLTINGVKKPSSSCVASPIPLIGTRYLLPASIVNVPLSFFIIPYLLVLKPKVVVVSVPEYYPLIPVYLASKLFKAKVVIDVRDPTEEIYIHSSVICSRYDKIFVKNVIERVNYAMYRRADAVIAVTKSLKIMLEDALGRRIFMAPNGADLEIFKPLSRDEARKHLQLGDDDFIFVYTGIIGGYYQFARVLKAFRSLRDLLSQRRVVKLLVAGPLLDSIHRSLLLETGSDSGVAYLGILDLNELKIVLSAADIGLIPRVDDLAFDYALPAKFYEYIAMELPVLALCRRESELARVIRENGLGFVCEPLDEGCIERVIEALALNPEIYSKLRENVIKYRKSVDRRVGGTIFLAVVKHLAKIAKKGE